MPFIFGQTYACVPDGRGGWYLGGNFTAVGGISRDNLAHVWADGSLDTGWDPHPSGPVRALALSGSTLYVGGTFTHIAGANRNYIAALNADTGAVLPWAPEANTEVNILIASGGMIYAGGIFTHIGGQGHNRLAALDPATGAASGWNPDPDNEVRTLAVTGTVAYAGGRFTHIGGQARSAIAALNLTDGAATTWNPNAVYGSAPYVNAVLVSGDLVYAAGCFTTIGGQPRKYLAALDAGGAATAWVPPTLGAFPEALAISGTTLYVAGYRIYAMDTTTGNLLSWQAQLNCDYLVQNLVPAGSLMLASGDFSRMIAIRRTLAALDAETGYPTAWNPNATGTVRAMVMKGSSLVVAGSILNLNGNKVTGRLAMLDTITSRASTWNLEPNATVHCLATDGAKLYLGGEFTRINGLDRNRIAAIDMATSTVTSWDPNANNTVNVMRLQGSTLYVGGKFFGDGSIGGQNRSLMAALNTTDNSATAWNPNAGYTGFGLLEEIKAMEILGGTVYVAGSFDNIGGTERHGLGAVSVAGALQPWNPNPSHTALGGFIAAMGAVGSRIAVSGGFETIGGRAWPNMAELDAASGAATPWSPLDNGTYDHPVTALLAYDTGNYSGLCAGGMLYDLVPEAPTLTDSPGSTNINYTWTDNSDSATGFKIWLDSGSGFPLLPQFTMAAGTNHYLRGGLTPNTLYRCQIAATDGKVDSGRSNLSSTYTLCLGPLYDFNVDCDQTSGTVHPKWTVFTFTNPLGFGPGTHGGSSRRVGAFRYAWDASPTHIFSGDEPLWDKYALTFSPAATGDYYLHLRSQNQSAHPNYLNFNAGPFRINTLQNPAVTADTWNVLYGGFKQLSGHTLVWTGSKALIWGGRAGGWNNRSATQEGWIFDPETRALTPMSIAGAPSARFYHTAVWTGSRMAVWGGQNDQFVMANTGGLYDPATNSWSAMSTAAAPTGRAHHTAVWTGTRMIVWGGVDQGNGCQAVGGIYDPVTNTWGAIPLAPLASRTQHTAVWTGSRMIVWGGCRTSPPSYQSDGASYDPLFNQWVRLADSPLAGRDNHYAVWTGAAMAVLGGSNGSGTLEGGGLYVPCVDRWVSLDLTGAGRTLAAGACAGFGVFDWGGCRAGAMLNDGLDLNPALGTWHPMADTGAPARRVEHRAEWAGNDYGVLIVGGVETDYNRPGSLAVYRPVIPPTGSLEVTLGPAQIESQLQWRRIGTLVWRASGQREEFVPTGPNMIEFQGPAGWIKPTPVAVMIYQNETRLINRLFSDRPAVRSGSWRKY